MTDKINDWMALVPYTVRSRRSWLSTNARAAAAFSKVNTARGKTIHSHTVYNVAGCQNHSLGASLNTNSVGVHMFVWGPFPWLRLMRQAFSTSKFPNREHWNGKRSSHQTHLPLVIISIMFERDISSRKASTYKTPSVYCRAYSSASLQNLPCQHTWSQQNQT